MSIIKGTNQIVAGFGGTKRSIGEVYFSQSALATDNSGALPLFTGETIASANTIYPEFYNWVSAHTALQCTAAEYEASLTTYGECAKYVIGGGSLRLPLIKNYIKAANTDEGIKNIEAGLPNITGTVPDPFGGGNGTWTGAFAKGALNNTVTTSALDYDGYEVTFDASRSSAVYGKSSTVTPASTTLYPWVVAYTAAIPASTAQAAEFQQGLSGKADTNLGNLSTAGKALASGLGMPSNRYIDLTFGASGTRYTAPANGYVYILGNNANSSCYLYLINITKEIRSISWMYVSAGNTNACYLPVSKNDVFEVDYYEFNSALLRFIYAEGAE